MSASSPWVRIPPLPQMSKHRSLAQAKTDFLAYYSHILPHLALESYLSRKNSPVLLFSPPHEPELRQMFAKAKLSWELLDWFPYAIQRPPEVPISDSLPGFTQGWLYSLNPASLLPILALHPQAGDSILDASAAPGGKTLAILNFTYPKIPTLIANDVSSLRFKRLKTTLKLFGHPEIPVTRHPIQALPHVLQGQFNKILLDAPCSSEKHVFNSKRHLKIWSPNRITNLVHLQQLLINSLLSLLKPGGLLVYSTCALSYDENENQVATILESHPELKLACPPQRINDPQSSYDPMFVASLKKLGF